ncbi:hypothetical protein JW998_08050 [candidate division KSB1 bacterium]|nr:hypothetical protein [candidate division KSB1 bacterium]
MKRSHVHATLAKIVLSSDKNVERAEKIKCLQQIVDGCFNALLSRHSAESAEAVGELLASNFIQQFDVLGDVQNALAHTMMRDLRPDEIFWLQPRLAKFLADMAIGYCRMMREHEKKELAQLYAENEARYRALFENTPFDVFGLTLDRRFQKINQNFQRNWGAFETKPIQSLRPMALARLIADLCDKVIAQQKTVAVNYRKKSQGVCRYFRIILAPIDTAEKVMLGFVGLIIDTTDIAIALDEKKTFAEKLIQTSEEEQRRISRDIHDSLGQSLFALQLDICAVKANLRNDVDRAGAILKNSEALLSTLMKETSNLCYQLSPRLLDDFGIVEALEELIATIEMTGVLRIDFEKKWIRRKKNKSLETALYRVSQEALANVLKHAHASHAIMKLHHNGDGVSLSIHDNGKGFDLQSVLKSRKKGFGLINMKERIELIGGTLTLQTAPNKGTKIDVNVPSRGRE